jgi:hypothetical protein
VDHTRDPPWRDRPLTLPNKSVLGEDIRGIEVTVDADNVKDGVDRGETIDVGNACKRVKG